MNNVKKTALAGAIFALVLLVGCSTGDTGGIFGPSSGSSQLRGTVDYVNPNAGYIDLINVNSGSLNGGGGGTARIYFDNNTTVSYNNQQYRPTDLERGDQVTVSIDQSSGRLYARSMTVTYNANASGSSYPSGTYPPPTSGTYGNTVTGTVNYVDTSRQTIDIDPGTYNSRLVTVQYDSNTIVNYNGQRYRPADLERGDRITVNVRDVGNGRLLADTINVTYNASGGGTSSNGTYNQQYSTVRGTVNYVDTNRRTIELTQTSWINGFAPGTGSTTGGSLLIQYDTNAQVNVQGSMQPVSGLERGDIIDVEVYSLSGGGLQANRIYLVRDVRSRY